MTAEQATERFPTLAPIGRALARAAGSAVDRLTPRRVSLRSLIVIVLVVGGGLGWYVREVREQRAAVAAITRLGGVVVYDLEWRNATASPYRRNSWSPMQLYDGSVNDHAWLKWLIDRMGIDAFGNVVSVTFPPGTRGGLTHLDAPTMRHLGNLGHLNELGLWATDVTDDDLEHLGGLNELRWINLTGTAITDDGLKHLHGLTDLRSIMLVGTNVTDQGVDALENALPMIQIILMQPGKPRLPQARRGR